MAVQDIYNRYNLPNSQNPYEQSGYTNRDWTQDLWSKMEVGGYQPNPYSPPATQPTTSAPETPQAPIRNDNSDTGGNAGDRGSGYNTNNGFPLDAWTASGVPNDGTELRPWMEQYYGPSADSSAIPKEMTNLGGTLKDYLPLFAGATQNPLGAVLAIMGSDPITNPTMSKLAKAKMTELGLPYEMFTEMYKALPKAQRSEGAIRSLLQQFELAQKNPELLKQLKYNLPNLSGSGSLSGLGDALSGYNAQFGKDYGLGDLMGLTDPYTGQTQLSPLGQMLRNMMPGEVFEPQDAAVWNGIDTRSQTSKEWGNRVANTRSQLEELGKVLRNEVTVPASGGNGGETKTKQGTTGQVSDTGSGGKKNTGGASPVSGSGNGGEGGNGGSSGGNYNSTGDPGNTGKGSPSEGASREGR